MTSRARRTGTWLLVPLRHGISLRLLVALALLSTVTSVLLGLGLGRPAWADDADTGTGESGSSSTLDDGAGAGGGSGGGEEPLPQAPADEGDGSGGTGGDDGTGSNDSGQDSPEADPDDEGDGSGGTGGGEVEDTENSDDEEEEDEETAQEEFDRLVREQQEADALNKGVISAFDVRDADGAPVSTYQVYSETGDWDDWDLKVKDFFTQAGFTGTVWVISFTCWLIAWALAFSLAALLFRPVLSIANSLHSNVLVQMGLPSLFLAIAAFVAAWHWMFGSRARGWGEAAAALTVSALAIGALASPPDLLLNERDGVVGQVQQLAIEIASLTVDPPQPPDPNTIQTPEDWEQYEQQQELANRTPGLPDATAEVSRPITDALVDAFIVRPSQLLSYGQTFTGECAEDFASMQVRQRVFEAELDKRMNPDDPVGNFVEGTLRDIPGIGGFLGDWFRERSGADLVGEDTWFEMTVEDEWQEILDRGPIEEFEEECLENAEAAKRASWDKVGGAFFALMAAVIAAIFVLLLVCAFLSAQFWLAVEAILAKLALVIGVLPGIGRSWLVARATEIGRRLMLMVVSVGSLGVFISIITELVNAPEEQIPGGVTTRFIIIDIACVAGLVFRRRLTHAAANVARRTRDRIDRSPFVGDTTGASASSRSGFRSGFGRGGSGLRQVAWLAAGLSTGGGSVAARTVLRAPAKAAVGGAVFTGRTAGVMARGAQIGARGASTAGRAVFTQPGRAQLRNRVQQARGNVGVGLPATVPADAAQLRARIAGLRAAAARRAGSPARPAGRMWVPAGARPTARINGPAVVGPRGGWRRGPAGRPGPAPGRGPRPAAAPPVHGGAGTPAGPTPVVAVTPAVAAMRRKAARVQARQRAAARRQGQTPGSTPPGTPAPTPPVQPGPPLTPRRGGRRGGGGGTP